MAEGNDSETGKEKVYKTLTEELGIPSEDIDFACAKHGEKCLSSVEKFFQCTEKCQKRTDLRKCEDWSRNLPGRTGSPDSSDDIVTPGSAEHGKMKFRKRHSTVNIAVVGMSGKGKSSLINSLRNLQPGDEGAADVDETECTTSCRPYPYPDRPNLVLWDVPGAGTPAFPQSSYLDKIDVNRYSFFLIISSERFSEIDLWLMKEIRKRHKHFYFIRTKIDVDLNSRQNRRREGFDETKEFQDLKNSIHEDLKNHLGNDKFYLFLISNNNLDKYDFTFLLHHLNHDVSEVERGRRDFRHRRHRRGRTWKTS